MVIEAFEFSGQSVAVAGTTDIGEIFPRGEAHVMMFEVTTATNNLDAFSVHVKPHTNSSYIQQRSAWTTIGDDLLVASSDVASLSAGSSAVVVLFVPAAYAVKFVGSAASGAASVTVRGMWKNYA